MKVKICGITNLEDALVCERAGADALGFIHYPGKKRHLPLERIASICDSLGPFISKVVVSSAQNVQDALGVLEKSHADAIQLYSLSPEELRRLRLEGYKVIRALPPDAATARKFSGSADALLFESGMPGTGTSYNYRLAPVNSCKNAVIGGGLTLLNLTDAKAMKPYGLDVSSGVESSIGRKDPTIVREFIRRSKE